MAMYKGEQRSTPLDSTLAYVSPMQFEKNWHAVQPKKARS
jgi:hypothetical protein